MPVLPRPHRRPRVPRATPFVIGVLCGASLVAGPAQAAGTDEAPSWVAGAGAVMGWIGAPSSAPISVGGTVRATDGTPVAGATVTFEARGADATLRDATRRATTRTGIDGRYRLDDVVAGLGRWTLTHAEVHAAHGMREARRDLVAPIRRLARDGEPVDTAVATDLVIDRATAVLAGRVSIRRGPEPLAPNPLGGATVTAAPPGLGRATVAATTVAPDGRYALELPPGDWVLRASAPGGLPSAWPDVTVGDQGPSVAVGPGDRRTDLDITMRARLPYDAYTEDGHRVAGWDPADARSAASADGAAEPHCYGPDPDASRGSRAALVLAPFTTLYGPGREPWARMDVSVGITNDGTRPLILRGWTLTGGDGIPLALGRPHRTSCLALVVAPGGVHVLTLRPRPGSGPTAPAELTIPDDGDGLRVPFTIRDPYWNGAPTTRPVAPVHLAPSTRVPRPTAGPAPTLAGLELTRRRVRVHFPSAGRATVAFLRRSARGRARWRTVRTLRLRRSTPGDRSVAMPRLSSGRYRVRLTTAVVGQPVRTLTVLHRVGARAAR